MDKLSKYLLEHIQVDFSGDIELDAIKQMLRDDNSPAANQLLTKLAQEGLDDLLIVLADCLKDCLPQGVNENVVKEQLNLYGES